MTLLLPLMGFLFISLLVTAIGMRFMRGETAIERRLGELGVSGPLPSVPTAGSERLLKTLKRLGHAAPKPSRELGKLKERLIHSGYRGSEALTVFFGIRLGMAILLFVLGTSPLVPKSSLLAGLAGAAITLAIQPGWFGDLTVNGRGWIAVGLVIFARWDPFRVAVGAYLFAAITRMLLDIQGPTDFLGIPNPFFYNQNLTYLLGMLPYVLIILAVIVGSREATRKRIGAPAALGVPYIRGERGS